MQVWQRCAGKGRNPPSHAVYKMYWRFCLILGNVKADNQKNGSRKCHSLRYSAFWDERETSDVQKNQRVLQSELLRLVKIGAKKESSCHVSDFWNSTSGLDATCQYSLFFQEDIYWFLQKLVDFPKQIKVVPLFFFPRGTCCFGAFTFASSRGSLMQIFR